MSGTLFLELSAKSLLVGGAALLALRAAARRSASERSYVAHLGLLATVAIPLAGLALPRWSPISAMPIAAGGGMPYAPDWQRIAGWLYLLPVAASVAVTLVAVLRLSALRARAAIIVSPPWLSALAQAQCRMGFKNGAALLVSRDVGSPVSWGLARPTIVVDAATLEGGADAEAIIAHELAHVARLDWAKLLATRLALALAWFNPFAWALARECHHLREEAADDAVLRGAIDRAGYAALLVRAARQEGHARLLAANGVAPSRGSLRHRITRVLDGSLGRAPARVGWSLACLAVGIAIGAPLAAFTLEPLPRIAAVAPKPARLAPIRVAAAPPAPPSRLRAIPAPPVAARAPAAPERPVATPVTPTPPLQPSPVVAATPTEPAAPAPITVAERLGEIAALRSLGITEGWLAQMKALGYGDLPVGTLMGMAAQGVSPSFVRGMTAAGYANLPANQLTALRVAGVSPRFAARMARGRSERPSTEQLIAAAILGDDPPETADD